MASFLAEKISRNSSRRHFALIPSFVRRKKSNPSSVRFFPVALQHRPPHATGLCGQITFTKSPRESEREKRRALRTYNYSRMTEAIAGIQQLQRFSNQHGPHRFLSLLGLASHSASFYLSGFSVGAEISWSSSCAAFRGIGGMVIHVYVTAWRTRLSDPINRVEARTDVHSPKPPSVTPPPVYTALESERKEMGREIAGTRVAIGGRARRRAGTRSEILVNGWIKISADSTGESFRLSRVSGDLSRQIKLQIRLCVVQR